MARPDLVDAWELDAYCSNADAADLLHRLLLRLVLATGKATRVEGFRGREGLRLPGWDGRTTAGPGFAYLPEGDAGWEVSAKRDVKGKADQSYANRITDPDGAVPSGTTLVIATMRRWPNKERWRAQKSAEGRWRDVVALDADDIHGWLTEYPDVHRWATAEVRPAPLAAAPSQLPPDIPDFVGRKVELASLRALCRQSRANGPLIITITGKPGVGKTALAGHLAHELGGEFPDGQLYADLRGTDRTPVDTSAVQSRFLESVRASGMSDPVEDSDYLTGLYRTAFSDRRTLSSSTTRPTRRRSVHCCPHHPTPW